MALVGMGLCLRSGFVILTGVFSCVQTANLMVFNLYSCVFQVYLAPPGTFCAEHPRGDWSQPFQAPGRAPAVPAIHAAHPVAVIRCTPACTCAVLTSCTKTRPICSRVFMFRMAMGWKVPSHRKQTIRAAALQCLKQTCLHENVLKIGCKIVQSFERATSVVCLFVYTNSSTHAVFSR